MLMVSKDWGSGYTHKVEALSCAVGCSSGLSRLDFAGVDLAHDSPGCAIG